MLHLSYLEEHFLLYLYLVDLRMFDLFLQGQMSFLDLHLLELLKSLTETVTVPVVASGGAGTPKHMYEALTTGKADAALAAGIFHYRVHTIGEAKEYLREKGLPVRPITAD